MLTHSTQRNLVRALAYFSQHLSVGDYYSEDQAVAGEWFGLGAQALGLSGAVGREDFSSLCHNQRPGTEENLTPRTKTTRRQVNADQSVSMVANRRLFYDFTISPPKSVSVVALVAGDERVIEAHDRAVRVMLKEWENYAMTRVHHGLVTEDRPTGNILTAVFRHDTSRELDPHLHSHCAIFNATFDPGENRWKALQASEIFKAMKFAENLYYHELARDLQRFGYRIRNLARGDFEIEGVPACLLKTFSKRTLQIDEQTRELLARSPELATRNLAEIRSHVAHSQREWKTQHAGLTALRQWWDSQLNEAERQALNHLNQSPPPSEPSAMKEDEALTWTEKHLFERRCMVKDHWLWRFCLERGRGSSFGMEEMKAAAAHRGYLGDPGRPWRMSTKEALEREDRMVEMAKEGLNACDSLVPDWPGDASLDKDQGDAARHLLSRQDFMMVFRGGAGTGKSFTLRTVYDALRNHGHAVQVLAPQRQQVEGLERDGLSVAQTLASFLLRSDMPQGGVLILDEAGQVGGKDMLALLTLAKERQGRVILSGDSRQHRSVEASDALYALEKYGNLPVAELKEIRRQDPSRGSSREEKRWIARYKQAVEEASAGRLGPSFDLLDEAGAIVECAPEEMREKLAAYYLELVRAKRSTLIVSPTWDEIHKVNTVVRKTLQEAGLVGQQEWPVTALQADDLTDAQKFDARYYQDGRVIVFNQTCRGIPKGETGSLVTITKESIIVEAAGRIRAIPLDYASRLTVCKPQEMKLAKGDRLMLKANATVGKGQRLMNGELVTVRRVYQDGRILLDDERVLPPSYRQFVRGYAITSFASQGKTVDHVLMADSGIQAATNARQWYVTISRGRLGAKIFTPDKEALRDNIMQDEEPDLALPVAAEGPRTVRIGSRMVQMTAEQFSEWSRLQHERLEQVKQWQSQQQHHAQTQSQSQSHDTIRTNQ